MENDGIELLWFMIVVYTEHGGYTQHCYLNLSYSMILSPSTIILIPSRAISKMVLRDTLCRVHGYDDYNSISLSNLIYHSKDLPAIKLLNLLVKCTMQ